MDDGAALLRSIRLHPAERVPQFAYRDWANENPDAIRRMLESAVAYCDLLTADGIGLEWTWQGTETPKERWASSRAALLESHDGFAASMVWLATRAKRKTPDHSSYHYKHEVERFWDDTPHEVYVANGVFIAAAICSGFGWRRHGTSVNVGVCISRRSACPYGANSR